MKTDRRSWSRTASIPSRAGILISLGNLLVSCGGGGIGPRRKVDIAAQPENGRAIEQGGTVSFSATGTFDQTPITQMNLPVRWTSSNLSVATIDPNTGIATCLAEGGPVDMIASAAGKGGIVHGPGALICQVSPDTVVKLDPASMRFVCHYHLGGACGCTPARTVTLTNVGGATLGIDSIGTVNNNFSQSNNCGASVHASQSCTIDVSFSPHHLNLSSDEIKVIDNGAGSPQTANLVGTAYCIP